jgi:hypothetical protein
MCHAQAGGSRFARRSLAIVDAASVKAGWRVYTVEVKRTL